MLAWLGLILIVAGILLVAGLTHEPHRAPKVGIFDFSGNLIRVAVLIPFALRDRLTAFREARM